MSKIFSIMGKTSTGKDTLYKQIINDKSLKLKTVVSYTTRPMRIGEKNGCEYFFTTTEEFHRLLDTGKVIEHRCYHTVHGDWHYYTVDDGQIDLDAAAYLLIMTLEGYEQLQNYYGRENVVPLYVEADDAQRLKRYIAREERQPNPNFSEVCRRYLADEKDFSEENITRLGIKKRYVNDDFVHCADEIIKDIKAML